VRRLLLRDELPTVHLAGADWQAEVVRTLAASGAVRLRAARGAERELRQAVVRLIATPVDVDFLQFYPAVEQVRRDDNGLVATLILREIA
jgi:hypothetical protein